MNDYQGNSVALLREWLAQFPEDATITCWGTGPEGTGEIQVQGVSFFIPSEGDATE